MSKSNAFETDILELIFNATTLAEIAENDTTAPATTLTVALHTSSPGETGTQATNEATYGSYARVAVNRNSGGWTVANGSVSPVADITFAEATSGSETITHFSIGTGTGNYMLYYGTVTPNIAVTTGVQPVLTTASTVTED